MPTPNGNYRKYTYMTRAACPAGASVTEGFEYCDVHSVVLARGELNADMEASHASMRALGFIPRDDGWCGEFYIVPDANHIAVCIWPIPFGLQQRTKAMSMHHHRILLYIILF